LNEDDLWTAAPTAKPLGLHGTGRLGRNGRFFSLKLLIKMKNGGRLAEKEISIPAASVLLPELEIRLTTQKQNYHN